MRNSNPFWKLVRQQLCESRVSAVLAAAAMIALTATELLRPWPLKIIFDHVLLERPLPENLVFAAPWLAHGKTQAVVVISLTLVAIAFLKGVFAYMQTYHTSRVGNEIAFHLRTRMFAHLQRLSLVYHSQRRMGELLTKIGSDTATVKTFFADSALTLVEHAFVIVASFAVMFLMNWKLTLVVLATFPLLVVTVALLHRQANRAERAQRRRQDAIATRISEALSSVQLIQAFGREGHEQQQFDQEKGAYLKHSLRNARIESAAARAVEVTSAIGTCAVVLYGSLLVIEGSMSPGSILVFSSYLHGLYRPIRRLVKLTVRLSQLQVSIDRISEILSVDDVVREPVHPVTVSSVTGDIQFTNVSFAYTADRENVLSDVSFRITPGEHVAIIGASGAGKSTLIGLILRLFDPRTGSITLDGVDIRDYSLQSLRDQVGVVLQDSLLLGTSAYENIAYGNLQASQQDVIAAARAAHAHDFIMQMPNGYSSIVGGRGARLSGGQQRRIAIARALVRNAPVLILDEPMSGLDAGSVAHVQEGLKKLMSGRTCLLITHDLAAAAEADRVILLENGRVASCGRPGEVLTSGAAC